MQEVRLDDCRMSPVPVEHRVCHVSCGHGHQLALTVDGQLLSWGNGGHGQLGHGSLESVQSPRLIEPLAGVVLAGAAAGGWHSAALSDAGDLYLWGWNLNGQLAAEPREKPLSALPLLLDMDVCAVSLGSRHTAAVAGTMLILENGHSRTLFAGNSSAWAWGSNAYGQLGPGADGMAQSAQPVLLAAEDAVAVDCSPWATLLSTNAAQFACAPTELFQDLSSPSVLLPRFQQQYRFMRDGLLSGQGPSATMSEQTDRFACEASTSSSAASNQSVILCQASTSSRQTCEGTSNRSVLLSQADNATSQSQKSFSAVNIDSISDNEFEPSVREPVQKGHSLNKEAFEQHVIRLLNTVRFMLYQHGDLLNKLCETVPSTTMSRHKVLISEPFSEMKQLLDFDEALNNKKEILVHEFSRLGGTDARWATKRIMAYCMDDSVASQLSWVGRKGKRSFCEMKIAKAVADAVCLLPDATTATVEANIKSWLRHAPERWAAKVAKNRPGPDTEHQTTESEEA
ncbi:hypothetical protein MTO96_026578 [Rhipicephalus appendiculatus]